MSYSPNLLKVNSAGEAELTVAKLIANKLTSGSASTTFKATGDATTGDYEDPESNIEYSGGAWRNKYVPNANQFNDGNYSTNNTTPYTVSAVSEFVGGGFEAYRALDGNTSTYWATNGGLGFWQVDLGSALTFTHGQIATGPNQNITAFNIEGSNNGSTWTTIYTYDGPTIAVSSSSAQFEMTAGSYRYYRVNVTGSTSGYSTLGEVRFYEGSFASATNSVQARIPFSGTKSFVPASLDIKNVSDVSLTTGQVNVAYSFDDVSYSSLVDIDTFKALSKATFANKTAVWLKVQPVGGATIKDVFFSTEGTEVETTNGFKIIIDAIEKTNITSAEAKFESQVYSLMQALTSTTNAIAVDASQSNNFTHTTTENTTVSAPTNLKAGAVYTFVITQDGTTPYTLGWNAVFKGTPTALTASASAVDIYRFLCYDGTNLILLSEHLNV